MKLTKGMILVCLAMAILANWGIDHFVDANKMIGRIILTAITILGWYAGRLIYWILNGRGL